MEPIKCAQVDKVDNISSEAKSNKETKGNSPSFVKQFFKEMNWPGAISLLVFVTINISVLCYKSNEIIKMYHTQHNLRRIIILLCYFSMIFVINIIISYATIDILNIIHDRIPKEEVNIKKLNKSDAKDTFSLVLHTFWTFSFIIWILIFFYLFRGNERNYLKAIFLICTAIPYKVGIYYIWQWSSLLYRTNQPERNIHIDSE